MSVHQRLLKLHATQQARYASLLNVWSSDWRQSTHYTLMRSRGYIFRKITHFGLYITETIGISMLANLTIAKMAWNLMLAGVLLAVLVDTILQGSRFLFLTRNTSAVRVLALPIAAYAVFMGILYGSMEGIFSQLDEIVLMIGVSYLLCSLVETIVETLTFRLSLTERVYFPPFLNILVLSAAVLVITAADSMVGLKALVTVIVGHCIIRIVHSTSFLYFAYQKKATQMSRRAQHRSQPSQGLISRDVLEIGQRMLLMLSAWVQPGILIASAGSLSSFIGFAGAWGLFGLMASIVERPYRALLVDMMRAIQLRQWRFITLQVRLATQTSFGLALAFSVIVLVGAAMFLKANVLASIVWMITLLFGRVLVSRLLLVGAEDMISKPILVMRILVTPILWYLFRDNTYMLPAAFGTSEIVLLAWCYRNYLATNLTQLLAFRHSRVLINDFSTFSKLNSKDFVDSYRILSSWLDSNKVKAPLYMITLRRRVASEGLISNLQQKILKQIGKENVIVSLDSKHVLIWSLKGVDINSMICASFNADPMLIQDVAEIDGAKLSKVLRDRQRATQFMLNIMPFSGKTRAIMLDSMTNIPRNSAQNGKWWVLDEGGLWQSRDGEASMTMSSNLHGLSRRSLNKLIWIDPTIHRVSKSDERYWLLHPFGEIFAIYESKEFNSHLMESLSAISSEMIGDRLALPVSATGDVSAEVYHWTKAILELFGAASARLRVQELVFKESKLNMDRPHVMQARSGNGYIHQVVTLNQYEDIQNKTEVTQSSETVQTQEGEPLAS